MYIKNFVSVGVHSPDEVLDPEAYIAIARALAGIKTMDKDQY